MTSLGLSAFGMKGHDLLELAISADQLGFDALWLGEHIFHPIGYGSDHPTDGTQAHSHHAGPILDTDTELTDPWAVHAAIAASTTRIRLGTAVYLAPLRHPLHTARTTITVQELSGGRVLLGVGAGWLEEEFTALGVPYKTRVSRTEECIEVLRAAWSGQPFVHNGKHFDIGSVQIHSRKVDIPVILGGNGPKALDRAARLGDGWFTSGTPSLEGSLELVTELARCRERYGKTDEFDCFVRVDATSASQLQRYHDHGMTNLVVWADSIWKGATVEERRANLAKAADDLGVRSADRNHEYASRTDLN
ncbi:TIGR03619 family F420-dependent LLM class oxidoreductase [Rhodococcus sp. ACPA1]|uniref:TIGR03619 family F420-dependent LLM class oxidoreductase n=1 Tax=Rhodococcus sp. ACPA1 TaxID=2028572 RepID=UPI000BB0D35D|nr:TIGR03619 family F420-dependent LLM class oxidoreductase [Rhodococcus sp. ACPA1]PBC47537.1 LLM class F420-dependent oxidoreductase [Rhodococcus sp. ACPA1]